MKLSTPRRNLLLFAFLGLFGLIPPVFSHDTDQAERMWAELARAIVTLDGAAEAVQKKYPKAQPVEASFLFGEEKPTLEVISNNGDAAEIVKVDGRERTAGEARNKGAPKIKFDPSELKITLAQAISSGQKECAGGIAFHAKLERDEKKLTYIVDISGPRYLLREVQIDARTGNVNEVLEETEIDQEHMGQIVYVMLRKTYEPKGAKKD